MNRGAFEFWYRQMEAAHGYNHNPRRMEAYFDVLKVKIMTDEKWKVVASEFIRGQNFPKIADILNHPELRVYNKGTFDPFRWIDDDCRVKGCSDGFVFVEGPLVGQSRCFRCPECRRADEGAIPFLPQKYDLQRFTDMEMAQRRNERMRIVREGADRYERARAALASAMEIGGSHGESIREVHSGGAPPLLEETPEGGGEEEVRGEEGEEAARLPDGDDPGEEGEAGPF